MVQTLIVDQQKMDLVHLALKHLLKSLFSFSFLLISILFEHCWREDDFIANDCFTLFVVRMTRSWSWTRLRSKCEALYEIILCGGSGPQAGSLIPPIQIKSIPENAICLTLFGVGEVWEADMRWLHVWILKLFRKIFPVVCSWTWQSNADSSPDGPTFKVKNPEVVMDKGKTWDCINIKTGSCLKDKKIKVFFN